MRPEDFSTLPFDNEYQKMLSNIYFTHVWLNEQYQAIMKKYEITIQQYNVLGYLHKIHPAPTDLQTIRSVLIEPKADATRLIERLIDKGFVTRRIDPKNKRKVEIRLTAAGKKLSEKIEGEGPIFLGQVSQKLQPKEAKQLNELLSKIYL